MRPEGVNIFRLLQLLNVVEQLAANHTHGCGPAPGNSGVMTRHSQQTKQLSPISSKKKSL